MYHAMACLTVPKLLYLGEHSEHITNILSLSLVFHPNLKVILYRPMIGFWNPENFRLWNPES